MFKNANNYVLKWGFVSKCTVYNLVHFVKFMSCYKTAWKVMEFVKIKDEYQVQITTH